ncbi:MAG: hypothetical protein EBU66_04140 [Bacteroidetes bacterium]|nr:hypothetical protein [bacterium]NBP63857.1 hypothetical protein [Bacteroidota bacterium]
MMKKGDVMNFPSKLETLLMLDWSRDENGLLRADYPNGAGYVLIRDNTAEYYDVCVDGEYVLVETRELAL